MAAGGLPGTRFVLDACGCPGGDTQQVMTARKEDQDEQRLCPQYCVKSGHTTQSSVQPYLLTAEKLN